MQLQQQQLFILQKNTDDEDDDAVDACSNRLRTAFIHMSITAIGSLWHCWQFLTAFVNCLLLLLPLLLLLLLLSCSKPWANLATIVRSEVVVELLFNDIAEDGKCILYCIQVYCCSCSCLWWFRRRCRRIKHHTPQHCCSLSFVCQSIMWWYQS